MKKSGMSSLMQPDSKVGRDADGLPVAGQRRAKTGHLRPLARAFTWTFVQRTFVHGSRQSRRPLRTRCPTRDLKRTTASENAQLQRRGEKETVVEHNHRRLSNKARAILTRRAGRCRLSV